MLAGKPIRSIQASLLWLGILVSSVIVAQEPLYESITHGDLERQFIVHVPQNLPAREAGLVIAMHGYGSSAENIMAYSGLNALADEHGYIVAYPQGTQDLQGNAFFNVGYAFHSDSALDDVGYIRALVARLVESYQIDPRRVYATGMSNGGDMSYLLACKAADVFRAIAPVAGTMMQAMADNCAPSTPMPVLALNGTADNVTRYAGDYANEEGWGAYISVSDVIDLWARHARAQAQPPEVLNYPSDQSITVIGYVADGGSPEIILYQVEDGGHDWPGARFAWWDLRRLFSVYAMGFGEHRSFDTSAYIFQFFNKNN
jgi:polyhydroxybutyrate depolymerase